MSGAWWTGIPATRATLSCGGETHRLAWSDGELVALDHSDPEGERALAALGGEQIPCIAMLDTWQRHTRDAGILLLSSRGPADLIATPEQMPPQFARPHRLPRRGVAVAATLTATASNAGPSDEQALAQLLSLGGAIGRRLETTVAAHWQQRLLTPDAETERLRARLHAAVYGRLLTTISGWLDERELALELELLPPSGGPGAIQRLPSGGIHAALPFSWLVEVWGRGLEIIWGRLCLSASSSDGRQWELQTVDPGLQSSQTMTIALPS